MKKKELDQISIIDATIRKKIKQKKAAEILELSTRQIQRKIQKYKLEGSTSLAHKGRGKQSNRSISKERCDLIIELIKTKYTDFGPTLAAEKLIDDGINIDHETLRKLMIKEELWQSNKRKLIKHVYRERKHHFGELIQGDGSPHKWFNDEYSTLLALIDDATGKVELMFAAQETTEGFSKLTMSYLKKYGRPLKIYTDRGKVFKVNKGDKQEEKKTQYGRMLDELNISIIFARSPQAKGRVERLFKTLQDRLVKELKLNNITNIDDANQFLEQHYMTKFNQKFPIEPLNNLDFHRSIDAYDLNSIFCIKENRILNNDLTISYQNRLFVLEKKQPTTIYKSSIITVNHNFDKTIELIFQEHKLAFKEIDQQRAKKRKPIKQINDQTPVWKPKLDHPWRNEILGDISKEFKRRHF